MSFDFRALIEQNDLVMEDYRYQSIIFDRESIRVFEGGANPYLLRHDRIKASPDWYVAERLVNRLSGWYLRSRTSPSNSPVICPGCVVFGSFASALGRGIGNGTV